MRFMRIGKVFLLISVFVCVSLSSLAQNRQFKNERRIYLWDVTLSMKGYGNRTPDIYDKVVAALEKDINSVLDEQTEIWVLPFQTSILAKWKEQASPSGKRNLISKIRSFSNETVTHTNIASPMETVMKELVSPDKRNVLILLTDGIQNDPKSPKQELYSLIRKWCSFAEENDAYAFYVMLTPFAQDEELIRVIDETCRMSKYIPDGDNVEDLTFVEFNPQDNYKYNIKDDEGKGLSLRFECKKRIKIPEGLKVKCYSEPNPYIEVDGTASVENGQLRVALKHKQGYDSLKSQLPQETNEHIMLYYEVEDKDKYPLVQLLNDKCCLELINKPEKTLKVYVKD